MIITRPEQPLPRNTRTEQALVDNELQAEFRALLRNLVDTLEPFCEPNMLASETMGVAFGANGDGSLNITHVKDNSDQVSTIKFIKMKTGEGQENQKDPSSFSIKLVQDNGECYPAWLNLDNDAELSSRQVLEIIMQEWPTGDTTFSRELLQRIIDDRSKNIAPEHIFGLLDRYAELYTETGSRRYEMQWSNDIFDSSATSGDTANKSARLTVANTNGLQATSLDIVLDRAVGDIAIPLICHAHCGTDGAMEVSVDYIDLQTNKTRAVPVADYDDTLDRLMSVAEKMAKIKLDDAKTLAALYKYA